MTWHDYATLFPHGKHTVVGNLKVFTDLHSPQLGNRRNLLVYLPPSYAQDDRRYPVLYMHDGQNLFDAATSYAGEWQVDETMERLSAEGIEAIVVGVPNMGEERLSEYSPFPDARRGGGRGERYLAFLTDTVKPLIDRDFRTRPERAGTGLMGSSMGGLISLYAFFRRRETFGFAGVMSPAFWFGGEAIFEYVRSCPFTPGRIYLDIGTQESSGSLLDRLTFQAAARRYRNDAEAMYRLLATKGYRLGRDLRFVEERGAGHNEAVWARRLPAALRFLLAP